MHIPDLLGLTPLAWAVIYGRSEQARILLETGAHPYGEPYWERPHELWPVTLARHSGNDRMLRLMQPHLEARGLTLPARTTP